MLALTGYAQKYNVYSVSGKVTECVGKNVRNIKPKMVLPAATSINVDEGARIILIDEQNNKLCTIKGKVSGKVADVLKMKGAITVRSVSPKYVAMLLKRSADSTTNRNAYMQSSATSWREDVDSLFAPKDIVRCDSDSIKIK